MCKNKIRICIIIIVGCLIFFNITSHPIVVKKDTNTKEVESCIVKFEDFGAENFTCTGLTWDEKDNAFWIGDYGSLDAVGMPSPQVIKVSGDLSKIEDSIDLSNLLHSDANLQGIAYDNTTDSLWLAVGESIVNISKFGEILNEFNLGKYSKYLANGICVDGSDNTLWVLCYSEYLLHYEKDGSLIEKYSFNYENQDQICLKDDIILVTVGADYTGDDNYVMSFDKCTGKISVLYQIKTAYAIEGICSLGNNIYITNDGYYHNAQINESYICIFESN